MHSFDRHIMVNFSHVPEAATWVSEITMSWTFIEYLIDTGISLILGIDPKDGRLLTTHLNVEMRLEALKELAMRHLGQADAQEFLEIAQSIKTAQYPRNLLAHGIWQRDTDGVVTVTKFRGSIEKRQSGDRIEVPWQSLQKWADDTTALAVKGSDLWTRLWPQLKTPPTK